MLPTVADDKFTQIKPDYFTELPEVAPGAPVTAPGVQIDPLIYATVPADQAAKINVPAWVGLGQFSLPAGYEQKARSVHANTTVRVTSGELTVRSSDQAQVIRAQQPTVPSPPRTARTWCSGPVTRWCCRPTPRPRSAPATSRCRCWP